MVNKIEVMISSSCPSSDPGFRFKCLKHTLILLSVQASQMLYITFLSLILFISVSSQRYSSRNKFEAKIVASFVTERSQPVHYETGKPALTAGIREANRRFSAINFNLVVNNDSDSCFYSYAGGPVSRQFYSNGKRFKLEKLKW